MTYQMSSDDLLVTVTVEYSISLISSEVSYQMVADVCTFRDRLTRSIYLNRMVMMNNNYIHLVSSVNLWNDH